jgi:hypothetical protein
MTGSAGLRVRREMIVSLALSGLKILAVLWLIRLADAAFAGGVLGIYLLARRLASTVPNLTGLGVGNALQRYLPALPPGDPRARGLLRNGLLAVASVNVVLLGLAFLLSDSLSAWFFPDAGGYDDIPRFTLWVAALFAIIAVHFLVNGTLLGRRHVLLGQVNDLMTIGGWQLIAFAVMGDAVTPLDLVRFQVIMMALGSLVTIPALYVWESRRVDWKTEEREPAAGRPLLVFGPTRALVTFMDASFITVGPWILRENPEAAGAMVIALTVLRAAAVGLTPLSKVAGVVVAELESRRASARVTTAVGLLAGGGVFISMITAAVLVPVTETLLRLWLPDEGTVQAVDRMLLPLLLALPAAGLFLSLKVVVDVRASFPLNAVSLGLGIASAGLAWTLTSGWGDPALVVAWAIALGHGVLGLFTLVVMRDWLPGPGYFAPGRMLLTSALGGLVSWGIAVVLPGPVGALLAAVLGGACGSAAYLAVTRERLGGDLLRFAVGGFHAPMEGVHA